MTIEITMPKLSDTMKEGKLLRWHKRPGDEVSRGNGLAEVQNGKARMVMGAADNGVMQEIILAEGESAPVGAVIARMTEISRGRLSRGDTPPEAVKPIPAAHRNEYRGLQTTGFPNTWEYADVEAIEGSPDSLLCRFLDPSGNTVFKARVPLSEIDPRSQIKILGDNGHLTVSISWAERLRDELRRLGSEDTSETRTRCETCGRNMAFAFTKSGSEFYECGCYYYALPVKSRISGIISCWIRSYGRGREEKSVPAETDTVSTARSQRKRVASRGAIETEASPRSAGAGREGLDNLVGLDSVKRSLDEIRSLVSIDQERRRVGISTTRPSLHAVFAGNPGTGKTTVARIYAETLRELGYLKKGQLVEADRSKLVADYLGQTASKTMEVLQQSLGGVLFIDEAYALKHDEQDSYGQECIDTILKFMEDRREDLVVIIAGYRDRMDALLEANPGFRSRFPQYLAFDDYTNDQLRTILTKMCTAQGYTIASQDLDEAIDTLARERTAKYFGNARAVRNLLEQAARRQAARLDALKRSGVSLTREELMRVERSDLLGTEVPERSGEDDLDKLVGLSTVKVVVREYETLIRAAKARAQDSRELLQPYFVMTGNPGTGKTTVARIMGRIFKQLDYLPSDLVVEASRDELVAGYVGQTAIKTRQVLERALGGTLFIDEAYSLVVQQTTNEDFGREAIETLLKFMEDNRGRLVVIVAGYDREMREFLNSNPGLRSRFTNVINFPDYDSDECATIFFKMLEAQRFAPADEVRARLPEVFGLLKAASNWSNGRDVRTLLEFVARTQARRFSANSGSDPFLVTMDDVNGGLQEFLRNKSGGA